MQLILLGTEACHLCEQAAELLNECLPKSCALKSIDIAEHPEWQAKYAVRIPVVLCPDSQQELGWPFDARAVNEFIASLE